MMTSYYWSRILPHRATQAQGAHYVIHLS